MGASGIGTDGEDDRMGRTSTGALGLLRANVAFRNLWLSRATSFSVRTSSAARACGAISSGAYTAGSISASRPLKRSSPITPTICHGTPQKRISWPMGSWFAK